MVAVLLSTACGARATALLPPEPAAAMVTMRDYRFESPPLLAPGPTIFRVRNVGLVDHKLEMVRLPDDFKGTLDQQFHSQTRIGLETIESLSQQVPGDMAIFRTDLAVGRYGFVCFVRDADGRRHADKGMSSEFTVR